MLEAMREFLLALRRLFTSRLSEPLRGDVLRALSLEELYIEFSAFEPPPSEAIRRLYDGWLQAAEAFLERVQQ
jgi:hypothetical protein